MVCEMVCEMKNPISQTTAQKTALKTALKTGEIAPERPKVAPEIAPENLGEMFVPSRENGHIISVITAEEELGLIKTALKIALEIAPENFMVQKSKPMTEKTLERRSKIIQHILRDKQTTIFNLAELLAVSIRTLKSDVGITAESRGPETYRCKQEWLLGRSS
jgi:hypothetical protein